MAGGRLIHLNVKQFSELPFDFKPERKLHIPLCHLPQQALSRQLAEGGAPCGPR